MSVPVSVSVSVSVLFDHPQLNYHAIFYDAVLSEHSYLKIASSMLSHLDVGGMHMSSNSDSDSLLLEESELLLEESGLVSCK